MVLESPELSLLLPAAVWTYDHVRDGRLRTLGLKPPSPITQSYAYDPAGELTQISYQRGSNPADDLAYTYDTAGRRTSVSGGYGRISLPAAVSTTTYNAANQLTKWGTKSLTYDVNGNLTKHGTQTYT